MGIFEALLIVVVLALNFMKQLNKTLSRMPEYPFYTLLLLFVAHLIFESFRWQLTLFYMMLVLYLLLFAFLIRAKLKRKVFHVNLRPISTAVVVITLITVVLTVSFPVIKLPEVTGVYNVGTVSNPVMNLKRTDPYSKTEGEIRQFNIQIFYPSDERAAMTASWLEDKSVMYGLAKYLGVPKVFTSHLGAIKSNSYHNVEISTVRKWPVVIVSHGWNGFRNIHQDIVEDLASRGFVVVAIDHTYGSLGTMLEDGSIQLYNEEALPKREESNEFLVYGEQLIETYSEDIYDTIRALETLNKRDFNGGLDLQSIALIGHSTGGGAALKVAMNDDRVDALIAYDPWVEPLDLTYLSRGLDIPTMIISSSDWVGGFNAQNLERVTTRASGDLRHYEAVGFKHVDFALVSELSPLSGVAGLSGDVKGGRTTEILRAYNGTFLNAIFWDGAGVSDQFDLNYEEMKLISSVVNIGQ